MTREEFVKAYRLHRQIEEYESDLIVLRATQRYKIIGDHRQIQYMYGEEARKYVVLDNEVRDIIISHYEEKLSNLKKELEKL